MFQNTCIPEEDIHLINLPQTVTALMKVFVQHSPLFLSLYVNQERQLFSRNVDLSADEMFRKLMKLDGKTTNLLFSTDDYNRLIVAIISKIKASHLRFVETMETEEMKVFELTKWLFAPMRLNTATIPEEMKKKMLRVWLSLVFTLPISASINSSIAKTLPRIAKDISSFTKIIVQADYTINHAVLIKFSEMGDDAIEAALSPVGDKTNDTFRIIRSLTIMMLNYSIDIYRKFCPNIDLCRSVYPEYDGAWVDPLDSLVMVQTRKITEIYQHLD